MAPVPQRSYFRVRQFPAQIDRIGPAFLSAGLFLRGLVPEAGPHVLIEIHNDLSLFTRAVPGNQSSTVGPV